MKKTEKTDILTITEPEAIINYEVPYTVSPYSLPIEPNVKPNLVQVFNLESKKFVEVDSEKIQFTNWQIQNGKINFTLETNLAPGVYWLKYDAIPQKLDNLDWWSEWDFQKVENYDGSKTYNLLPFLEGLKDISIVTRSTDNTVIGSFCFAIWQK